MIFVGIDPGKKGGIAIIRECITAVIPLPDTSACINAFRNMLELAEGEGPLHVFIEKAQCMPKNGAVGMFRYGQAFGELLGALMALNIPHTLVPPRAWSRVMHAGTSAGDTKKRSLEACKRLFPDINLKATPRCTKDHDGKAEALLIAEFGRRQLHGQ